MKFELPTTSAVPGIGQRPSTPGREHRGRPADEKCDHGERGDFLSSHQETDEFDTRSDDDQSDWKMSEHRMQSGKNTPPIRRSGHAGRECGPDGDNKKILNDVLKHG